MGKNLKSEIQNLIQELKLVKSHDPHSRRRNPRRYERSPRRAWHDTDERIRVAEQVAAGGGTPPHPLRWTCGEAGVFGGTHFQTCWACIPNGDCEGIVITVRAKEDGFKVGSRFFLLATGSLLTLWSTCARQGIYGWCIGQATPQTSPSLLQ